MLLSFLLPELAAHWQLSSLLTALVGSASFCGALLSSHGWGLLADRYGRRVAYV
jgi:MFS family permease